MSPKRSMVFKTYSSKEHPKFTPGLLLTYTNVANTGVTGVGDIDKT